jgi:tripartite-type tricarboxylate transporter receptor subunit TctC
MKALLFVTALCVALTPVAAAAQKYPERPVKVIVPYTAGGGTDTVARALSQRLSEIWGQPVVVENRPGAGTSLGADAVAKSMADGYTLLFTDSSSFVINPHIYPKLPFDPLRDLAPVSLSVRLAPVLAISSSAPGKTVPELIAYAKAHPGELTYASPGVGSLYACRHGISQACGGHRHSARPLQGNDARIDRSARWACHDVHGDLRGVRRL